MTRRFQRRIEDFRCEHCNAQVAGDGYTNHCPQCLWSKHVDVNPGDRADLCGGMMKPVRLEGTVARYRVVHRCEVCGVQRRNDVQAGDDPEAVVAIAGIH